MTHPVRRAMALASALILAAGCGRGASATSGADDLSVFAAASLTESFTELARRFEAAHGGTSVRLNFGPSPELARQIVEGAQADVYAGANPASVRPLAAAGVADGAAVTFARNRLQIAVPRSNPARIAGLRDLGRDQVTVALCAVEVPCGAAAKQLFDRTGLTIRPVTYERDVKAVLAKVRLGEVDAGLVYRTDIRAEERSGAAGPVTGIEIPDADKAVNDYPIVAIRRGNTSGAERFIDFVLSPEGQSVLADAGFDAA